MSRKHCIKCHFLSERMELNVKGIEHLYGEGDKRGIKVQEFPVDTYHRKLIEGCDLNEQNGPARDKEVLGWKHGCYFCFMGVWDEDHITALENEYNRNYEIKEKKRDDCFYWDYTVGMKSDAAKILQKRDAEYKKFSITWKATWIGLIIAGIGLIVTAVFSVLEYINKCK